MNNLLDVIGDIYEASFDPNHWNKVASGLCKLLNAHSCGIFMEDYEFKNRDIIGSHGLPKAGVLGYRLGLSKYDLTFQLQAATPPGQAEQLVDARDFKTTHPFYYRLILKPNDVGFLGTMGIYNNDEWHVGVALHRSFNSTPFGADELQKLELLYPHFGRAMRIQKEFYKLRSQQHVLQEALGQLSLGLITLDAEGYVDYCNPIANELLINHMGLKINPQNKVQAYIQTENKQLQQLLNLVATKGNSKKGSCPQVIALHHPEQKQAIHVTVALLKASQDPNAQRKMALYLSVPHSPFNISADVLHTLYTLTPAESGIAIALLNGLSLTQISQNNRVSIETVRSQLKSIFTKMGVKKQQEVIRVLLSGIHHI